MSHTDPIAIKHRRLLRIAGYVASREQPTTAEAIRIHFSMSQRAVYRNINMLKDMGIPIRGGTGVGYVLKPSHLSAWLDEALYGPRPSRPRLRETNNEGVRLNA